MKTIEMPINEISTSEKQARQQHTKIGCCRAL